MSNAKRKVWRNNVKCEYWIHSIKVKDIIYRPTCWESVTPALELKLAGGETPTEFGNQPSGPQLEDKSWELFFWPAIQSHCCLLYINSALQVRLLLILLIRRVKLKLSHFTLTITSHTVPIFSLSISVLRIMTSPVDEAKCYCHGQLCLCTRPWNRKITSLLKCRQFQEDKHTQAPSPTVMSSQEFQSWSSDQTICVYNSQEMFIN